MNLFNFDIPAFLQFVMVFVRISAVVYSIPIIGSQTVPKTAKIGLAAAIAFIAFSSIKLQPVDLSMPIMKLILMLLGEVAIGLTIGFAAQLIFTAVQLAGSVIGFQMGFAIVNVMDPATQEQVSITAQFQNIMALLIFLAIDGHHMLINASVRSFEMIPLLGFNPSSGIVEIMLLLTKNVFISAIKIAAPIMAALFLLNVALGLVARTVPQMNVFIIGFPLQIAVGLFMIGATAPIFGLLFKNDFMELEHSLHAIFRLLA
ncbi:MAG: flagellar biosynthetic protein FliR [Nitrospinota bacterium]|nr:flagellar biosynthetic protein FliR [Nitrospinota bacterium]